MAHSVEDSDSKVRDYLLETAVDFRQLCSTTLEGYTIEGGQSVWDHLSGRVDALMDGREVLLSRDDLPLWHPESTVHGGRPDDRFVLGADDVLRPYEPPRFTPNRAQRRANGWRGNGQI
jgi:hypothetical protein